MVEDVPFDLDSMHLGDWVTVSIGGVAHDAQVVDFGSESRGVWLQTVAYRFYIDGAGLVRVVWKKPSTTVNHRPTVVA